MSNPFAGIISTQLKDVFKNAIDALLETTALTKPCALIYGDTIQTECTNCYIDIASKRSANMYKAGGSIVFADGQICPYCNGQGLLTTTTSEIVYLAIIWNYSGKHKLGMVDIPVGSTVTICSIDLVPKLKRCKEIVLDVSADSEFDTAYGSGFAVVGYAGIDLIKEHRFVRDGEPEPAGFGSHDYAFTLWKKF